ncbi:MAG TPA: endonuclease/exonuclease/phosphatase family protein [Opitutaceae bacterium]|jgi:endonuclease/exonuclease/phosphatase family metal-dependent hydrolase|nr:endonuclease/exonuclease/phosphatase family protein [Opitutaceae bacterium]
MSGRGQASVHRLLGALLVEAMVAGGASAGSVTVATYNVENYVAADRRVDEVYRPAYPKPEAAKTALRAVIRALDADVLALQEMGPDGYLEELRRDLRAEGLDYPHVAMAEAVDADRHVAVLSRIPFGRVQTHADLDFRYFGGRAKVKRGLLEVAVTVDGTELTLFVVHLRSRFTERPDDPGAALFRAGEAAAVRDLVLRRFPDPAAARFVVLGDCNDTRNSKPLRLLTRRGGTMIATLAKAADPNGETWTYYYHRDDTYSRVDYVLVSPGLASAVAAGGARVYDGPGVREASDHRPVVVRLELPSGPRRSPER